jgi:hypothetical protein
MVRHNNNSDQAISILPHELSRYQESLPAQDVGAESGDSGRAVGHA